MSVLTHLHPNHPFDYTLSLVPIKLVVLILHDVFLRCTLLMRVSQPPATNACTVVLMNFDIRTSMETS